MAEKDSEAEKTPLPPGMVLGPDGKPCKICTAFRNWKPQTPGGTAATVTTNSTTSAKVQANAPLLRRDIPLPGCPPDVEQLGRATWTFLHTTAAYYPDKPTPKQRANMLSLLRTLPTLYPCTWCAQDFGQDVEKHPPDVSSRTALSRWLCERHNEVNAKLGKERFNCNKVDERWKDGPADGSCD